MEFYLKVKSKIEEHTEYLKAKLEHTAKSEKTDSTIDKEVVQKVPTKFRYLSILNADNSPIEEDVKSIKIIAFTHSGGSRKRKKRNKRWFLPSGLFDKGFRKICRKKRY